jgi:hypothetical protein
VPKRGNAAGVEVAGAVRGGRSYLLDDAKVAVGAIGGERVEEGGAALENMDVAVELDAGIDLMFIFCGGAHCFNQSKSALLRRA